MPYDFRAPLDGVAYVEVPVSGITSNIYVYGTRDECLLIDSGGAAMAPGIIETLTGAGVKPKAVRAIVITHGHGDHYGGAAALAAWSGAEVWAHLGTAVQIEDHWGDFIAPGSTAGNLRAEDWERFQAGAGHDARVGRTLREGDAITVAGRQLDVLHLPGHQRGLVALVERERRLAFVGDLVQGGADCSANWLGLYEDVAGQRRSLERLRALDCAWVFRGHRPPQSGANVPPDIAAALGRLDAIERATLDALRERSPLSLAELGRQLFKRVLRMDVASAAPYGLVTALAFLIHLAQRGLVRRNNDLEWELGA